MFLSHLYNGLLSAAKYLIVSIVLMFASLCLMAGQFPPPLAKIWYTVKQTQEALNTGHSPGQMIQGRQETAKLLEQIKETEKQTFHPDHQARSIAQDGSASAVGDNQALSAQRADEKIKALEYEVAYLKAKLARAEWEVKAMKAQPQAVSRQ